ncbi:hypothetical protein BJV74DRAFT_820679 [Russula compacta]|nr:hypothetical protein BJV74DRAFT_820679 [Russula compacta]
MSGADLYYWFASGFGQVDRLTHPHLSAFDVPIIEALVAVTVQYFFAYRVWVLSNKKFWWILLIISVCSVVNLTGAFIGAIYGFVHDRFANGPILRVCALTWLIGNAIADISISLSLLYYLTRRRPGVAGERYFTNHALSKIVRLTVETNLVTSTDGVVALVMAVIYPSKNWFTCPVAILGKLYSNTLLVSLNNRISIREGSTTRDAGRRSRTFTVPSSNDASSIVHLELEKTSQMSKRRQELGEDERRGEIIGESSQDIA